MSRTPQKPILHGRTESYDQMSAKTHVLSRSIGVDESLRSYKLLDALRLGDIDAIDRYLFPATTQSTDPRSSMGSLNTADYIHPLILAVQCADTKTVQYVLSQSGIDVNSRDAAGNTALHIAAQLDRIDVIDLLMDHPEINDTLQNSDRKQPFQVARNSEVAHHMQVKRGQYIEKVNAQFQQSLKTKNGALEDLLDNSRASSLLDLNRPDTDGNTALHNAAASRDISLVSLLLNHGADAFPRNKKGKLPIDLSKDDKIKALFKNVPQKAMLNASPKDPIRHSGHLKKWTNYKSGYKARWFVLESGVLSYYRNQDESENACRGSINMKVAKIVYHNGDKCKFEVLGPDKNGFHVKAAHPTEAKNWIWNLNQAKTQARDAGKVSPGRDLTGVPIASSETASIDIPNGATQGFVPASSYTPSIAGSTLEIDQYARSPLGNDGVQTSLGGGYAASFSDADSEMDVFDVDTAEEPHQEVFTLTANSAKLQLEVMDQICDSILSEQAASGRAMDPRMQEVAGTFRSSATSLREVLTQLVTMANDREKYWRTSVDRERKMRVLWEENMQSLATDQDDLERRVHEANLEKRSTRKALKQARSELVQVRSGTPAATPSLGSANIKDPLSVPQSDPYVMDSDSSGDEFYDAVGSANGSTTALTRSVTQATPTEEKRAPVLTPMPDQTQPQPVRSVEQERAPAQPSQQRELSAAPAKEESRGQEVDRISTAFHGYEGPIRSDMGRLDDRPSVSLWGILKSMIGKDMSKMTLPVSFNEATSLLQRVAEDMEYTDLLDKAAGMPDAVDRALYVAVFAASEYASTIDRVAKPFNPLLHETFEYCRPDKGFRFVVEQVSHHPPIGAAHAEARNWEYYGESSVKSKFTGKSFDINPLGTWFLRIRLPSGEDEFYSWMKVNTQVVGILMGSPTVDNYGPMVVKNHTNGAEARLDFKARGWRGADAYKVSGVVVDAQGTEKWSVSGKWNERLYAHRTGDKSENTIVWSANPRKKGVPFNLTTFAMSLNALDNSLKPWLPPTDTRLRPDQRAMEDGKYDFAADEKNRLEEKQRATRRMREKGGLEHGARWFKESVHPVTKQPYWQFTGEYWQAREDKHWTGVEDIF